MNSALKVLLQRREDDRKELEEKVLSNVKELVVHNLENSETAPWMQGEVAMWMFLNPTSTASSPPFHAPCPINS